MPPMSTSAGCYLSDVLQLSDILGGFVLGAVFTLYARLR